MNANTSRSPKHGKELPYSVSPVALGELLRLIRDESELDEGQLDSAWLGLERPSPDKRGADHVIVTMSKSQADALRGLIDGAGVSAELVKSATKVIERHARALSAA
jgi:hypothetical protein